MTFAVFASIVWITTLCSTGLFILERAQGRRYAATFRVSADEMVVRVGKAWSEQMPTINRRFFRHLFHYNVHIVLSRLLHAIQWSEKTIRIVLRLNRKKAVVNAVLNPDSHLQKVAAHKEESALTQKQKKARKEAALRGEI